MDLGIKGRKALVNGGSAGLGKGSAKALAAEGVELYISARSEERLLATAEERFGAMALEQGTTYEQVVQQWIDDWRIPANKFGDIDEFGAICALFCSKQASYIIGQSLVVDGGVTNATF